MPRRTTEGPVAPGPLGLVATGHSPVEAALTRAGATFVEHDGATIAADFGSAAGELAILIRAVGIADRADLGVLELTGHPGTVVHTAERVAGRAPSPGSAVRTSSAWWCLVGDRVLILCEPARRAALAAALAAAVTRAPGVEVRDVSDGHAAVSVVGPRAPELLRAVTGGGAQAQPAADGACVEGELAGTPVLLLRESATQHLLVMARGDEPADWQALLEAGRALGVAYVGREALEHYAVHARTLARRHDA
jgi:heterotetrameric sarcosine oxidase gamma subunit